MTAELDAERLPNKLMPLGFLVTFGLLLLSLGSSAILTGTYLIGAGGRAGGVFLVLVGIGLACERGVVCDECTGAEVDPAGPLGEAYTGCSPAAGSRRQLIGCCPA